MTHDFQINEKRERATQLHNLKLQGVSDRECAVMMGTSTGSITRIKKSPQYGDRQKAFLNKQNDVFERLAMMHLRMVNTIEKNLEILDKTELDPDQRIKLITSLSKFLTYTSDI